MTTLCAFCNAANKNRYPPGDCFICANTLDQLDALIKDAAEKVINEHCSTFCISTRLPDEWLVREEELWDREVLFVQSIKNIINKKIIEEMARQTGLRYDAGDGEIRIIFELKKGRTKTYRENLFVFGRYKKQKANISQSRWICMRCHGRGCKKCEQKGKHYVSVEELIGEPLKKEAAAANYSLHASGREDVDATNTAGRPFVLEIINPNNTRMNLEAVKNEINAGGSVEVGELKRVRRSAVELVANSHFDKEYEATIELGHEVTGEDIKKIESLSGALIEQRTPERVAHRRADLIRKRRVKKVAVLKHDKNHATIRVFAEAGTYIKELISGDQERTKPSIAELLGTTAKCMSLEVTEIKDEFLDLCI